MTEKIDLLALRLVGGRLNPEPSRAREARYYRDPARWVKFGKRGEAQVERQSDQEKADTLLIEWYRWSKEWRPNLGVPRVAPECRQSVSSRQYDEDAAYDRVYQKEMEAVDFCVDAIGVPMQQAIGSEMKNREVKAKVWRSPSDKTYADALTAVVVVMRKRGLFD